MNTRIKSIVTAALAVVMLPAVSLRDAAADAPSKAGSRAAADQAQLRAVFLVANKHDDTLTFIDPNRLEVIATIPTGPNPHEMVVTPDQRFAYFSNYAPPGNGPDPMAWWFPPVGACATPNEKAPFAFGVIADVQYCDAKPAGTRYYRASAKKLAECVDALNQMDLAFVIHLGDFIDRGIGSYDAMLPIYNRLKPPHYQVLGNHDFAVAADKLDEVTTRLGLRDRYYSFRTNGCRFVVLDGNDVSLFARAEGSPEHDKARSLYAKLKNRHAVNAQTWNGAVGQAQRTWLDRELAEADAKNERVVVFCHYPVYPENPHNLWNDREIVKVLESHRCVVAFMNGHNHAGNYAQKNGIHYLTFPGMVETAETTAYAVVHVDADGLRVTGYGRTPSRRYGDARIGRAK